MDQTRVNLSTTAMGILAFVLAYFGYVELLFLLIAYAVFLDKNQKLAKISFQALYLQLAYRTVLLVLGWVFGFFNWFFNLIDAYGVVGAFASIHDYIRTLLGILIFVAYLLGVLQIMKGKDCNLPILGTLADKTLGIITKKSQTTPAQPAAYAGAPVQPQQPQFQPQAQNPVQPTPAAAPSAASGSWICSCGHENTGNFCVKCGNPRSKA
ncbi:MAG: hypothetical protein PWP10_4578 [Clostridiales bacterium]|jgi:uncharacterized membrane protein|nr:hypothetical protein [Clostridiales bacterium]